jgi:hypothetical protein
VSLDFTPGMLVHNPDRPEWGLGRVQSAIGTRVTVTFEHAGKQAMNLAAARLEPLRDGPHPRNQG